MNPFKLFTLLALFALGAQGQPATTPVLFNIYDFTGSSTPRSVYLLPVNTWLSDSFNFFVGGPLMVTNVTTNRVVRLVPNDYTMQIQGLPGSVTLHIGSTNVTNNALTYTTNTSTYTWHDPAAPWQAQLNTLSNNVALNVASNYFVGSISGASLYQSDGVWDVGPVGMTLHGSGLSTGPSILWDWMSPMATPGVINSSLDGLDIGYPGATVAFRSDGMHGDGFGFTNLCKGKGVFIDDILLNAGVTNPTVVDCSSYFEAARSMATNGVVWMGAKNYLFTNTWSVMGNLTLIGIPGATKVSFTGSNLSAISTINTIAPVTNATLYGICYLGSTNLNLLSGAVTNGYWYYIADNGADTTNLSVLARSELVYVQSTNGNGTNFTISKPLSRKFNSPAYLHPVGQSGISVDGVQFVGNGRSQSQNGIYVQNVANASISRCRFDQFAGSCIYAQGCQSPRFYDITCTGFDIAINANFSLTVLMCSYPLVENLRESFIQELTFSYCTYPIARLIRAENCLCCVEVHGLDETYALIENCYAAACRVPFSLQTYAASGSVQYSTSSNSILRNLVAINSWGTSHYSLSGVGYLVENCLDIQGAVGLDNQVYGDAFAVYSSTNVILKNCSVIGYGALNSGYKARAVTFGSSGGKNAVIGLYSDSFTNAVQATSDSAQTLVLQGITSVNNGVIADGGYNLGSVIKTGCYGGTNKDVLTGATVLTQGETSWRTNVWTTTELSPGGYGLWNSNAAGTLYCSFNVGGTIHNLLIGTAP